MRMKKYTKPEIICRTFAAEDIVTSSAYQNSAIRLANSLQSDYGLSADNILKRYW